MAANTRVSSCVPLSLASLVRRPLRPANYVAPTAYRKLLLHVAYRLHPRDIEELRFFVKDVVPDESAADALTVLGLLECLERRELLGPEKWPVLQQYLKRIGREDLAAVLDPLEDEAVDSVGSICTSIPSLLSHMETSPGYITIVWPLNTYRRNSLEVFRQLTVEEVEQVRWLSQDFLKSAPCWSEEMSGVKLLSVMETSGLVGPGNYSFLVNCLEEIGRHDLVFLVLPSTLPHLPSSLDIPSLLHHRQMENIQLKKTQYKYGMQTLMKVIQMASKICFQKASDWHKRMIGTLSTKSLEKHSCFILESVPATLTSMSLHLNALVDGLQEYEHNGYTEGLAGHLYKCEEHHNKLQALMEKTGWDEHKRKRENTSTSRQHHPVRQASYGAFSGLVELLLEFSCNKEQFQEESRHLSHVLFDLESLLRLAGYMWSQTSWLIALFQVAVRSPVYLTKYDHLFQELLHNNRHIIRSNAGMLEAVLSRVPVGRQLLKTFRKKGLINDISDSDRSSATLLHVAVTPIPVFVFVLLMLSEHPSLAPDDVEEIIESLKQHISEKEEGFCEINISVTMMVLQGIAKNIEAFQHSKLQQFHSDNRHGIEEMIRVEMCP